jgi:hypothetical protein
MAKPARGRKKDEKSVSEPRLGIFWLVARKVLLESAPLTECERYGDHLNYGGNHINAWELWKRIGAAPEQSEYEEFPRGRVIHNVRSGFTILADKCLLNDKHAIGKIKRELHLPKKTILDRDPHYRCATCLYGTHDDE